MKYHYKLNLIEYIQVVNEIVQDYFDPVTYEYTPHIGELHAVSVYYNHCVELEKGDSMPAQPITDIKDMQRLLDDEEFMVNYVEATLYSGGLATFSDAYDKAMDIVEYKKSDANSFALAISTGMGAVIDSLRGVLENVDVDKFAQIAKEISSGKISNEAIAEAYSNSDRFKSNTESINETTDKIVNILKE